MADSCDIVVIGTGLAGLAAASGAARQGLSVALVGARDRHPPDFRGEKLGEAQMQELDRVGLGEAARRCMTRFEGVWCYRFGRLARRSAAPEYSSDYAGLVNALADALSPRIARLTGRVAAIATSEAAQEVRLADGRLVAGRLLVVATGLGDAVRRMLGFDKRVLSAAHSVSIGFDLTAPASTAAFPSLVWGSEPADPLLSYLTVFPMREKLRGNLFTYRGMDDPWVAGFRQHPAQGLRKAMPHLERALGAFAVAPGSVVRPVDLVEVAHPVRPGVVLLGDAFSTVCPITGMGMAKAINDAGLLAGRYLPGWLATPGMGADKIAAFYRDPAKTALDREAMQGSLVGRRLALGETPYWRARRFAGTALQRLRDRLPADPGPPPAPEAVASVSA